MRLIRVTTNYPAYLRAFYAQRPGLGAAPYDVQHRTLMDDCFGWADFWTRALSPLGYEVWEPVGNAEAAQKAWARENGAGFGDGTWLVDIAAAQVKRFRPDVVFVNDYATYTAQFFRSLRAEVPSIRLVAGWCGAPAADARVFREYDLVLSNIPALVDRFRADGHRCEHVRHAFEPRVLDGIDRRRGPATPFSFVGSIVKREGFHNRREQLLKALVRETGLEIFADAPLPPEKERRDLPFRQRMYDFVKKAEGVPGLSRVLAALPRVGEYVRMDRRPDLSRYVDGDVAARSRPPVFGLAMYQTLHESRVTLNTHIDISAGSASNMRLYEATGVGSCLLTERQPDLGEAFAPDAEVATYGSPEEAVEKARYLLEHEEARRAIAAAGQRRTLRDHTFAVRARQLDGIIRRELSR